jgi:acyl-CoA dehydrogenase
MREIVRHLLTSAIPSEPIGSVAAWWDRHLAAGAAFLRPIDRAIAGGFAADRLGYAFASGYHAALRALVPELRDDERAALCVTEQRGAHPRAIESTLRPEGDGRHRLSGHKRWATLSTSADVLLVVATVGTDDAGVHRLRVVKLDARRPGVTVRPMPDTPFAPEIPHAEIDLADVSIEPADWLPGDGYDRYVKPFRTIEDTHVHAALLGYVISVGRRYGWPLAIQQEALALIGLLCAVALEPPGAPETHLALGGAIDLTGQLLEKTRAHWGAAAEDERARWLRDAGLLQVASNARAKRLERAWRTLQEPR